MAIINTKSMLTAAMNGGYAIGAFNVENMEFVQAVAQAAAEMNAPVIIATSVNTLKYASPEMFASMVEVCANNTTAPIAIHLDHGEKVTDIMSVIRGGYRSIMFDGSLLSYAENVEQTRKIVEFCDVFDISVEAELGAIGGKPGAPRSSELLYTRPETAADFVKKTGVHSLAVAIGTAHGIYKSTPKLDYERLRSIRDTLDIPLVLHGASGLSDEQVQQCVQNGISKVNIATELRVAWTDTIKEFMMNEPDVFDPKKAAAKARDAVKEIVKQKIEVLGSANKANGRN